MVGLVVQHGFEFVKWTNRFISLYRMFVRNKIHGRKRTVQKEISQFSLDVLSIRQNKSALRFIILGRLSTCASKIPGIFGCSPFFVSYWVSNRATGLFTRAMDVDFTFWSPPVQWSVKIRYPPPYGMVSNFYLHDENKTLFEWDKCIRPQYKRMYSIKGPIKGQFIVWLILFEVQVHVIGSRFRVMW